MHKARSAIAAKPTAEGSYQAHQIQCAQAKLQALSHKPKAQIQDLQMLKRRGKITTLLARL